MTRYILCRPNNGMNDMLNHIAVCWDYAEKFDRTLVVDTLSDAPANCFGCSLDLFFQIKPQYHALFEYIPELDGLPHQLGDRYDHTVHANWHFNRTRDYSLPLIVYQGSDGGDEGIETLRRVRFQTLVSDAIKTRLDILPDRYVALHMRATDMMTNVQSFLEDCQHKLKTGTNVLICSDNTNCIKVAWSILSHCNLFRVSNIPDLDNRPLHQRLAENPEPKYKTNLDAFTDLMALSGATQLYSSYRMGDLTGKNKDKPYFSGFFRLAVMLARRPQIRKELMNDDN